MSKLSKLRTIPITYDYFNNLFDLFVINKNTNEFKEQVIPVVNMITQEFVNKFPNKRGEFEELFSECYYKALYYIGKKEPKDFENSKAFYGWITRTLRLSLFSEFKELKPTSDLSSYDEEDKPSPSSDIRDNISFAIKTEDIISKFSFLTILYDDTERAVFSYYLDRYLRRQDSEEPNYTYLEHFFNMKANRIKVYESLFGIILKLSIMLALQEDFSLKKIPLQNISGTMVVDKFYVILCYLEKYPYLIELYSVVGDKLVQVLNIFGGVTISVPTFDELKLADKYATIFLETLNKSDSTEYYKEVAEKYSVSVNDIRYNNNILLRKMNKFIEDGLSK